MSVNFLRKHVTKEEREKHEEEVHNLFSKTPTLSSQDQKIPRAHNHVGKYKCKFCERHFQNKNDLMKHNKNDHKMELLELSDWRLLLQ